MFRCRPKWSCWHLIEKRNVVATGGTFDEIHAGHVALLRKAFEVGSRVIIGVSSDEFAKRRGKRLNHSYEERIANLRSTIERELGHQSYEVSKLDTDFGPAVTDGNVSALVCSTETQKKAEMLNEIRESKGLTQVHIVAVDTVLAEDGGRISSTRIKAGEIDRHGKLLSHRG